MKAPNPKVINRPSARPALTIVWPDGSNTQYMDSLENVIIEPMFLHIQYRSGNETIVPFTSIKYFNLDYDRAIVERD